MYFQRIKTPGIAHVAYLLASDGQAAIVDPRRDLDAYLDALRENGLRLRYILETHRQEDFEMGGAHLRDLTGAQIVAADHQITAHADMRLRSGDCFELGDLTVRTLHTPGHTPESICYSVSLEECPERPWGVFTGDSLFIGDTGRTDLADPEKTAENAAMLYDGLHEQIFPLGEQAFVFPAHGAGSACGGNVADRDDSTLGIEQKVNAAATLSRDEFVRHKVQERMARPPYFRLMERVNLGGGRPFEGRPVPRLDPDAFNKESKSGIIIDSREPEAYAGGHVPGSYSVWLEGMPMYGGWITDDKTPIFLVTDGSDDLAEARLSLARVGRDQVAGALAGGFAAWRNEGRPIEQSGTIDPRHLEEERDRFGILDVREISEFDDGHIPNARHVHVGHLEEQAARLDRARPLAVTCSVGHRGSLGVSILKRHGFREVYNLLGGMTAWRKLGLPMDATEPEAKRAASG